MSIRNFRETMKGCYSQHNTNTVPVFIISVITWAYIILVTAMNFNFVTYTNWYSNCSWFDKIAPKEYFVNCDQRNINYSSFQLCFDCHTYKKLYNMNSSYILNIKYAFAALALAALVINTLGIWLKLRVASDLYVFGDFSKEVSKDNVVCSVHFAMTCTIRPRIKSCLGICILLMMIIIFTIYTVTINCKCKLSESLSSFLPAYCYTDCMTLHYERAIIVRVPFFLLLLLNVLVFMKLLFQPNERKCCISIETAKIFKCPRIFASCVRKSVCKDRFWKRIKITTASGNSSLRPWISERCVSHLRRSMSVVQKSEIQEISPAYVSHVNEDRQSCSSQQYINEQSRHSHEYYHVPPYVSLEHLDTSTNRVIHQYRPPSYRSSNCSSHQSEVSIYGSYPPSYKSEPPSYPSSLSLSSAQTTFRPVPKVEPTNDIQPRTIRSGRLQASVSRRQLTRNIVRSVDNLNCPGLQPQTSDQRIDVGPTSAGHRADVDVDSPTITWCPFVLRSNVESIV